MVVDPYPPRKSRRSLTGKTTGMHSSPADSPLAAILHQAGMSGVSTRSLPIRTRLTPDHAGRELQRINAIDLRSRQYSRESGEYLMARIESIVSREVANHPIEQGVSLQSTRAAAGAPNDLVDWALRGLVDSGRIEILQSLVRPAGWKPKLEDADQVLSDAIMHEICKQPSEPPSLGELESRLGGNVRALSRKLEREGRLERVSDDRYYSSEAVAQIVAGMRAKLEVGRIYNPAELKEVLGVSRKYLIPFLEFCDRIGVTERRQQGRAVRPMAVDSQG